MGEDLTDDFRRYVYVARGETLEDALDSAWERIKHELGDSVAPTRRFRIVDISVSGSNPFDDYRVILADESPGRG